MTGMVWADDELMTHHEYLRRILDPMIDFCPEETSWAVKPGIDFNEYAWTAYDDISSVIEKPYKKENNMQDICGVTGIDDDFKGVALFVLVLEDGQTITQSPASIDEIKRIVVGHRMPYEKIVDMVENKLPGVHTFVVNRKDFMEGHRMDQMVSFVTPTLTAFLKFLDEEEYCFVDDEESHFCDADDVPDEKIIRDFVKWRESQPQG